MTERGARARRGVQDRGRRDPAAARRLAGDRLGPADHRPGQLADTAGYAPYLDDGAEGAAARDDRRRGAADAAASSWAREHLAELEVTEKIRDDVREGDGQARSASSCCASSSPRSARSSARTSRRRGADDYRTRVEAADLPEKVREAALQARSASWSGPATRTPRRGWIRTWLDTVLDLPWNDADRRQHRRHRRPRGARRRPLTASTT